MLHHPADDLSRTYRCVSILLGRAVLRAGQHVHLLFPPVMRVRCANRTDSSTQHQRYHLLSAADLNSSRNRNFVHMKGERSGVVGAAFSGGIWIIVALLGGSLAGLMTTWDRKGLGLLRKSGRGSCRSPRWWPAVSGAWACPGAGQSGDLRDVVAAFVGSLIVLDLAALSTYRVSSRRV